MLLMLLAIIAAEPPSPTLLLSQFGHFSRSQPPEQIDDDDAPSCKLASLPPADGRRRLFGSSSRNILPCFCGVWAREEEIGDSAAAAAVGEVDRRRRVSKRVEGKPSVSLKMTGAHQQKHQQRRKPLLIVVGGRRGKT